MKKLSQPSRLIIWILYIFALLGLSCYLYNSPIPPTSEQGLWFYSCLASIVLGELITSPYFTSPADVISNTIAALITILTVNPWSLELPEPSKIFWLIVIGFNSIILIISIIQIVFKNSKREFLRRISRAFFVLTTNLGSHRIVFSTVILFALFTFHKESTKELLTISLAWVLLIAVHPIENIWGIVIKIRELFIKSTPEVIGEIAGHEFPDIILVKHLPEKTISYGDPIIVQGDNGQATLGCALDQIGFTGELWHRVLRLPPNCQPAQDQLRKMVDHYPTGVFHYQVNSDMDQSIQEQINKVRNQLIGIVAPDSDVMKLKIEIVRSDLDLFEGRLVEVLIGSETVLYQIVNGLTREEIVEQRNSRGYVRAEARKLGKWADDNFQSVKWVPEPNSPVFLVNINEPPFEMSSVGFIPNTNYHISVDLSSLVTHNTAILGILGVGKSCLAFELIERLITQRIKVICLDLTNQYSIELEPYFNQQVQNTEIASLQAIGSQGRTRVRQNVEEGGSIIEFRRELTIQLNRFLTGNDQSGLLRIYNPASFEVWRQDSKMYQNTASMATLTPCEITRIISEITLEILQGIGMSDQARCCLVFEESHSLVPEWNSAANDGDKTATNGTAKAILQGRKYGLGCLLITQRTANVTKSILNQCNTVFALRTFDSTGVEFLKNFVGDDYAGILSGLEDRHAVIFGKASSCKTPVLVRLNERDEFLEHFRPIISLNDEQILPDDPIVDDIPF